MDLNTQNVRVSLGEDEEGALVFADARLVALLVHLQPSNEIAPNCWYLEASFEDAISVDEIFPSLDAALAFIRRQLEPPRTCPGTDISRHP